MKLKLANRVADCTIIPGATRDIVDVYVDGGFWEDTGESITDAECELLLEANQSAIQDYAMIDLGCYS